MSTDIMSREATPFVTTDDSSTLFDLPACSIDYECKLPFAFYFALLAIASYHIIDAYPTLPEVQ